MSAPLDRPLKPLLVAVLYNDTERLVKGETINHLAEKGVLKEVDAVLDALSRLELESITIPVRDDIYPVINQLKGSQPDVVMNICESVYGDNTLEMNVPALLELLKTPYTGSGPLTLGLCQDKVKTKHILLSEGIPTPKYFIATSKRRTQKLLFPLIVKPIHEDAGIGITNRSVVQSLPDLNRQVEYILDRYRQPALVEQYIDGRELNIAIVGNEKPQILPVSEIEFIDFPEDLPRIVGYDAKWLEESDLFKKMRPVCPAKLPKMTEEYVKRMALKAYRLLGCRDYGRVDMRLSGGTPYILEVNPNPDISLESGFNRSLRTGGIPYHRFIEKIISFALERR